MWVLTDQWALIKSLNTSGFEYERSFKCYRIYNRIKIHSLNLVNCKCLDSNKSTGI